MSARLGLRGGHRATGVPTAIANNPGHTHFYGNPTGASPSRNVAFLKAIKTQQLTKL